MATAEPLGSEPAAAPSDSSRRWVWAGLAAVLLGALGLRLWGIRQGLPFAYNADEADHFVPHAIAMFEKGTLNPHYFANPPGFTYVLHYLFAIAYGGGHGAVHAYDHDPEGVYTLARVAAATLGTLSVWLLYLTGARLFGRGAGLLAAAIEAVAFLPVFYAHLALNDVPTLAPLTLSLLGSAGVLRKGRLRDHALAGVGLGLACAFKYTAGIVLLPYVAAAGARILDVRGAGHRDDGGLARAALPRALAGPVLFALLAFGGFVLANPYSLLDYSSFHGELVHQSSLSAEAQGKLGAPKEGGLLYYLWALTWGLGWGPALAALAGAVAVWRRDRRIGAMLVPAAVAYLVFMGTQGRYFGRWLMPILPVLCLLAAFAGARLLAVGLRVRKGGERRRDVRFRIGRRDGTILGPPRVIFALLVVAVLVGQGLAFSVHSGLTLSRTDTRTLTRNWMISNIPRGAKVVVEPVSPNLWANEPAGLPAGCRSAPPTSGYRWCKWPSLYTYIDANGQLDVAAHHEVGIENYVRTLSPALIGLYEMRGYCWVVTASTESGRAFADPRAVPQAVAYYEDLAVRGTIEHRARPYGEGERPVGFNFDWSFDYYPWAYDRPGPEMVVYRLRDGRCAG